MTRAGADCGEGLTAQSVADIRRAKKPSARTHLPDKGNVLATLLTDWHPHFPNSTCSRLLMRPLTSLRHLCVITCLIGAAASVCPIGAAETKTEMDPFQVGAEFGPDGLRIQNSQSVLNPYLLEQHGIVQLQDITGAAPNLFSSNSDSRGFGDVLALRGLANTIFFSAPAVALYVDDIPGGSVSAYPSALLEVDTLTIRAGPQGTEFGRNAPGGLIEIRTRPPGTQHQGRFLVDVGTFESKSLQAALNGPMGPQGGYSASFGYNDREGYIRNTYRERPEDDRQSVAGRVAFHWQPVESLQLRVTAMMEHVADDASRLSSLASPDPYVVSSDFNGETRLDREQFSFQARKKFGWGSLIATTSRQDWELDPATTDLDLSSLPLSTSSVSQVEDVWTQELRVESEPGKGTNQWRAGLFYFDSQIVGDATRMFLVPPGPFVPPGFAQTERTLFDNDQTSLAGYAAIDHPLAEKTTLKAGVRLERSETDISRSKTSSNNFGFPSPPEPELARAQKRDYLSASTGLTHAISTDLSLQARTSIAIKPEGFSAFTANPALARFDRERAWASEVGLTFAPPQGRFGGSILGFWSVIDGYQFERTVPGSTDFVVVNASSVISRGLEAKFMWNPVERLWWDFQAGYTDATFDDHLDATGIRVDGNRVPYIPQYTLRTGATVDLGHGFSANASYAAVGRAYYDERNTSATSQKSYGLVNAQLRYRFAQWAVTVYGHNLFEKDYYQFINPEIFAGSPGAPRRFGVQLSFTY